MRGVAGSLRHTARFFRQFQFCSLILLVPFLLPHSPSHAETGAWGQMERLIQQAIERNDLPGCVVVILRGDRVLYEKAFGYRQLEPTKEPMTLDTVFDLASLTKPIATASSVMRLMERGELRIRDPVHRYLPEFHVEGKDQITIEDLLTHRAGFVPDSPLSEYLNPQEIWPKLLALQPVHQPKTAFVYSDVGFQLLGRIVEIVSQRPLHEWAKTEIFEPLRMRDTGYLPSEELRARAAPTDKRPSPGQDKVASAEWDKYPWIRGEVHDPRAYAMGGVAGHAGLFSTAHDLTRYAQMMLNNGSLEGVRIFHPRTVAAMIEPRQIEPGIQRGLGWDIRSPYSINRGDLLSSRAFGHGGFTGTGLWIDPEQDLAIIFLSNRLHPKGAGVVNPLIGAIGSLAVIATNHTPPSKHPDHTPVQCPETVLLGIDQLAAEGYQPLHGKRIGLITNHTGKDRNGVPTAKLLQAAEHVRLVKLFSPEHGLDGSQDTSQIADGHDIVTQLPVYSLYGSRQAPTPELLKDIDLLVFDIQDIGTRFYTYISTMGHALRSAAEAGIPLMVLDRPNPIGGVAISGPVLDKGLESFVGFHPIPIRHGMTVGELARLLNVEQSIHAQLTVVSCGHWHRGMTWDATGLPWNNPSPNMRSLRQAFLYPGIGILETTNLSVGRGTDTPFEILGAPWVDSLALATRLRSLELPGVVFVPREFKPNASKFAGETCHGVEIIVTDRDAFDPVRVGLAIASVLRNLHPDDWDRSNLNRLLCDKAVLDAIESGAGLAEIVQLYRPELEEFIERSKAYYLYP